MKFRNSVASANQPLDIKKFGLGSALVNGNSRKYYTIVCLGKRTELGYLNSETMICKPLNIKVLDPYHFSSEEAYEVFVEICADEKLSLTRSDMGWNSLGLKETEVEYKDC